MSSGGSGVAVSGPDWPGGPPMDMRRTVEGIAWRFRTGAPWRDIPERFGTLEVDLPAVLRLVGRRHLGPATGHRPGRGGRAGTGGVDGVGGLHHHPRAPARRHPGSGHRGLVLTGGNAADTSLSTTVLECISVRDGRPGRPRTRPDRVLADKAYTAAANRRYLSDRGIKITIPEREDQKAGRARRGPAGGRPRSFDAEAYKGRNVVERCFNKLKQWRGIATRFDKTARSYLAGLTLAAALIWTR
jgi:transposase